MKKLNLRMLSQYPKWHDKPLRLTTAEMNDPHLVLDDFFQAYSLSDTRACLKELLEDALSADDVNPMSHFTLYDHIEKLIEAAFLIHQKKESTPDEETDLAGETTSAGTEENGDCQSEGNPYSKPKRLVDKVKTHPMNGLKEIFRLVDLEDLTQNLRSWIEVALMSEQSNYEQACQRAALFAFSEGFLPLMEALYLKSEVARLQQASGWLDELPRGLRRELQRTAPLTYLTGEQISNPISVLEAFCDRFSLPYGRAELWDLLDGGVWNFLNYQAAQTYQERPRAYVTWVLLDEQFKVVGGSSGFWQVEQNYGLQEFVLQDYPMQKNGYLYVYVSNETPNIDVYFDNMQVTHTRGPLLEETHYYPFGLTMAGISSKAANTLDNKYEFGGKEKQDREFCDGTGLETYDFSARMYDPQIGRIWQVDPWVEKYERQSPYVAFNDNPIIYADPTGKGGELSIVQREDGTFYLKVSAKIYVHSDKMSQKDVKSYASKIKKDIMSQWNNPNGKGYGQIGKDAVDVVFDVSVEPVTSERADELAKDNTNSAVNFVYLTNEEGVASETDGNAAIFNTNDLNNRGSTTAAHEFGHMLGYNVDKGIPTMQSPGAQQHDNDSHAWKSDPQEAYFIMSRNRDIDPSQRRVDASEYSRLGGGVGRRSTVSYNEGMQMGFGGLYAPTRTTNNIPIVNPNKPLTNRTKW